MRLATLFLAVLPLVLARPTTKVRGGRSQLPKRELREIGRLAQAVNAAYCPEMQQATPALRLQPPSRAAIPQTTSHVVATSETQASDDPDAAAEMSWYISHTPETQTLTLAYASLLDVEDVVELLAFPTQFGDPLVAIPEYMTQSTIDDGAVPRIHSSYLAPFEQYGLPGVHTLLEIVEQASAPASPSDRLLKYLGRPQHGDAAIRRVEVVGHGLGAAVGLLASLALEELDDTIEVHSTLFGLPRVGDDRFAQLVDRLNTGRMAIRRITSYKDTVTHLPERHMGLLHPAKGEIWISSDPRVTYACEAVQGENEACGASVDLGKSSLMDHQGPYGGIWIGSQSCESRM